MPVYTVLIDGYLLNYKVVLAIIVWLVLLTITTQVILVCFCAKKIKERKKKQDYVEYAKSIRRTSHGLAMDMSQDGIYY